MSFLKRIIDDYHVTMFLGVMFIVSGLMAASTEVVEVYTGFKVHLFHSMLFLGVFNCCMAVVFMILGARNVEAGEEAARNLKRAAQGTANGVDVRLAAIEARLQELESQGKVKS
jgi:hypothetical protein